MLVVDEYQSLLFELKDDNTPNSYDAVGIATYSNSKRIASSYHTIFESLWKQSELYEQVHMHDRLQKEFVDIAAHELRTPIQPILGIVDLLKNALERKATTSALAAAETITATTITDSQLEILHRNARRLQKLSAEILEATRIEAGNLKLKREIMDLNEKVKNVVADAKSMIPQDENIEIQFRPAAAIGTQGGSSNNPTPLYVNIDEMRMFEVISNIIRNAIKFSARQGKSGIAATSSSSSSSVITITTGKSEDGRYVIVSVKDHGAGISKQMLPRLFTKFSTDRERGGTGLGLFIAKNIVEAHGGRIWAENNNNNNNDDESDNDRDGKKGATFSFTLPLAD